MQNNAKLDKLYVKQSPHYLSKYHMPLDWINIHNNPECPSNFIEEGFCTCCSNIIVAQSVLNTDFSL